MNYPNINPVAFKVFSFPIHWYGLMYLLGLVIAFYLLRVRGRFPHYREQWNTEKIVDLLFYGALGVIVGGRLGYIIFYGVDTSVDGLSYLKIWKGGMSFHGGLVGVGVGMWYFCWRHKFRFVEVTDFAVPVTALGLGAGRIGNFINGELWGKPTDLPWGMALDCKNLGAGNEHLARFCEPGALFTKPLHPSQLYEAFFEGLVLFAIIWIFARKPRPALSITGLFLLCYGIIRICIEFVRLPDGGHYIAWDWLTRGQVLSLPMVLIGVGMLIWSRRYKTQ